MFLGHREGTWVLSKSSTVATLTVCFQKGPAFISVLLSLLHHDASSISLGLEALVL